MEFQELIVPFILNSEQFKKELANVQSMTNQKASGIGSAILGTGKLVAGAVAGLAVAGVGAITGAVTTSMEETLAWGSNLDQIQDLIGGTSEEAAGLALMVQRVGGDTDQLTGALSIMTRGLLDANGGLGTSGEALASLGVSIYDAQGNMRSANAIFADASNVLGNMEDGLEKSSILMDLFGRSGAEMGDILGAAANGGLANFNKEAKDLGLAFSDEQTQATIEYQKSMQKIDDIFNGLWTTIGINLLPVLTPLIEKFADFAERIMPKVREAIVSATDWITENFIPALQDASDWVSEKIIPNIENLTKGDFKFTIDGAINLFQDADQMLADFTSFYNSKEVQASVQDVGNKIGKGIVDGVSAVFSEKANGQSIAKAITDFFIDLNVTLTDFIGKIGADILAGFVDGILEAVGVPAKFRDPIQNALSNSFKTIFDQSLMLINPAIFGKRIIEGIAEGIKNNLGIIVDAMGAVSQKVVDTASGTLKIKSPSKVFEEIGSYTMQGLAIGIDKSSYQPIQSIGTVIASLQPQPQTQSMPSESIDYDRLALVIRDAMLQAI